MRWRGFRRLDGAMQLIAAGIALSIDALDAVSVLEICSGQANRTDRDHNRAPARIAGAVGRDRGRKVDPEGCRRQAPWPSDQDWVSKLGILLAFGGNPAGP